MVTYLAMTAAELTGDIPREEKIAYMACHFSPYNTGLSNIPTALPPGSMLILNDRIPICGHDPQRIADQLAQALANLSCDSLLLDFENPQNEETAKLCRVLAQQLNYPLGISHHYAKALDCRVFLPSPPLDINLKEYLKPWKNHGIWLESALEAADFFITDQGCNVTYLPFEPVQETFIEETLHCRYRCETEKNAIHFHLCRTADQVEALLQDADALGVEKAIGLYQQLGKRNPLVE